MQLSTAQQQQLLNVARQAIRSALAHQPLEPVQCQDAALCQPAGCFVTLHEHTSHRLRGCIGRLQSPGPLILSVQENAVAVLDDPRFVNYRVTMADLPQLELEISVLSPMETAAGPLDFDLLTHGLYLTVQGRSGCFLPQVARETGWTQRQLLERLCSEKLGLAADAWRDPDARLERFTCLVIGPEPFGPSAGRR